MKMVIMRKIGEELWDFVKNMGGLIEEIALTPYGQLRIGQISRATYYDKLNRFTKHGLLSRKKRSGVFRYHLTKKGLQVFQNRARLKKRTDGLATIIIFDVPIEKNKERTFFRRYLIRNGFELLQKSVLVSPNYLPDEVREIVKELSLTESVTIITGKISSMN
ncbi:MAG: hypothetical protein Q8P83_02460 [bacterium]|nr:hypothetical protein [bacterium]